MVVCFITVIVFLSTVSTMKQLEFPFQPSRISHATHAAAFNRLLNSIAKVNQQRLDGIKKLTKLQELKPYPELRADAAPGSDDSSSDEREVIYLVIPDSPETNGPQDGHRLADPIKIPLVETNITKPEPTPEPKPDIVHGPIRNHNVSEVYVTPRGTNESIAHMSLSSDGLEYLRQSIARSCKTRDVKRCKHACREAISSACSYYDCRRKLRKSLKKHCRKACKDEFKSGW